MARSSFRTKLVLVAGVSVAAGLLLSGGAAYVGIQRLGADAAEETQRGLRYASTEYLDKHIDNVAQHLSIELDRAEAELATFAAIQQQIIDHQEELQPVLDAAAKAPMLKDNLVFDPKGQWSQTGDAEPTTVTAWGYLHEPPEAEGEARAIREDVAQAIDDTALMDLLMPAIGRHGSRKLQIYYVGPKERAFARFFPAVPLAQTLDEKDPGHNGEVFWDHFFPSLVEGWTSWVGHKERFEDLARQITFLSPYDDAAGGGPIITLFQPLWSADRTRFAGALGFDLTLTGIIDYVEEVKLFESGFAFLAQDNGNVFAISERGSRTLGLSTTSSEGGGVSRYDQFLGKSSEAAIRDLKLPEGEAAESREIVLGGHNYVLELKRLAPFNVWGGTDEITEARWVVGFVVPEEEIYAALAAAQTAVNQSSREVLVYQVAITLVTLAALMLWLIIVSRRLTSSLVALSKGAGEIAQKNYDVTVPVETEDEIGALGQVFNQMVGEIREHTENLEGLVKQRTSQLEDANAEILALNERLKEENLRMGAELDVARRLQMMVLPATSELEAVRELDIAGFMRPADEVGGDYYDVLQGSRALKLGIGDVTGHGLESGVLMLMVQTAVRTLLASDELDPRRFLAIINRVICDNIARTSIDRTLTLSLLDYKDGVLTLAGQHEEVVVVRAGGEVERIDTMDLGLPIGIEREISDFIDLKEIRLAVGDVVVLYTDGITEAENDAGEHYEIDRLCGAVQRARGLGADEIRDALVADVMAHIGRHKILDDITTVILKRVA